MSEKTKRTISVSFDKYQIEQIDKIARDERVQTRENVTRSQIVRRIVDDALGAKGQQSGSTPPLFPASVNTPVGGRTAERSEGGAGGIEQRQED
jgi:hypothetical protein